jgi:hypothetical protein
MEDVLVMLEGESSSKLGIEKELKIWRSEREVVPGV